MSNSNPLPLPLPTFAGGTKAITTTPDRRHAETRVRRDVRPGR